MGFTELLLKKLEQRSHETDNILAEILGPVTIPVELSFDLIPPRITALIPDIDVLMPTLKKIIAHRLSSNLHQFPEYLKDRLDCVTAIVLSFCFHPYQPGINKDYTAINFLTVNATELENLWKLDLKINGESVDEFHTRLNNTIGAMMLLDMIKEAKYGDNRHMIFLTKKINPLLKPPYGVTLPTT